MIDREKVIKALDCEEHIGCSECPYVKFGKCNVLLIQDIKELLKGPDARILDWDELEDWENAVWFEDNDELECYIALIANVGTYAAKFTNVEPGHIHNLVFMRDFYMKEWRCWSSRPTIEQRQAVKWE